MNTKNLLLIVGGVLIVLGLFKPDFSSIINTSPTNNVSAVVVSKPSNVELLDECQDVVNALKKNSDRKYDGPRLAALYNDLATLISLDNEDMVVKNTEEVRQANKLAGVMLKLDIKGKYPELTKATNSVIVASLGDDSLMLDDTLRQQAVDGFKALAWACIEGTK